VEQWKNYSIRRENADASRAAAQIESIFIMHHCTAMLVTRQSSGAICLIRLPVPEPFRRTYLSIFGS
jgi:hypothetical protein